MDEVLNTRDQLWVSYNGNQRLFHCVLSFEAITSQNVLHSCGALSGHVAAQFRPALLKIANYAWYEFTRSALASFSLLFVALCPSLIAVGLRILELIAQQSCELTNNCTVGTSRIWFVCCVLTSLKKNAWNACRLQSHCRLDCLAGILALLLKHFHRWLVLQIDTRIQGFLLDLTFLLHVLSSTTSTAVALS